MIKMWLCMKNEKKNYEKPSINRLGTIEKLTKNLGSAGWDDITGSHN